MIRRAARRFAETIESTILYRVVKVVRWQNGVDVSSEAHAYPQLGRVKIRQLDHDCRSVIEYKREVAVEFIDPPLQLPEAESATVL